MKKLCAVTLAAAMAVGLAACGNDSQGGSSQTGGSGSAAPSDKSSAANESESAGDESSESAGGEAASDLEPITLNVATIISMSWNDYPDNTVAEYIRDKFGITFNVIDISERKDALMASGDLPDIFIIESNEVVPLIESGFIMPLDELMEKHDATSVFFPPAKLEETIEFQKKNVFQSDHIYGIMGYDYGGMGGNLGTQQWGLNVDWERYAQLGYPEIEADVDQIYQLLVDMVKLKPTTDNGLPVYAIAYPTIGMRGNSLYSGHSLGYYPITEYAHVNCKTQEIDMIYTNPESDIWQYNHMYWKLHQDGLLDPDSVNANPENEFSNNSLKAVNGQYVATLYHDITGDATATKASEGVAGGFEFIPVKGCTVDGTFHVSDENLGKGVGNLRCISSKTQYADRIMEFMKWWYTPEGTRVLTTGVEGDTWNYVDGVPTLTEQAKVAKQEGQNNDYYFSSGIRFGWNGGSGEPHPDGYCTNLFDEQSYLLEYASALEKDVSAHYGMTMTDKVIKMHEDGELYDHDFLNGNATAAVTTPPDDIQRTLNSITTEMYEGMAACIMDAKTEDEYFEMRDALIKKVTEMGMDKVNEWFLDTYNAALNAE